MNYIVDADIRGFYDHVNHEWMIRFLEVHIKDPNILKLVKKYLKAGVMDLIYDLVMAKKKKEKQSKEYEIQDKLIRGLKKQVAIDI